MQAGELDHRLTLLAPANGGRDGFNNPAKGWAASGNPVWASKTDVSDGERVRAAQAGAAVLTTRFVVRSTEQTRLVANGWRVRCKGVEYDVVAVKDLGRLAEREISAAAAKP